MSWDQWLQQMVVKHRAPKYCQECGREIILMRVMSASDEAVRRRQLEYGLCWRCAGGES